MKIFRNWKTTVCGLASLFSGVKILITTGNFTEAVTAISVGVGLIFSKDYDITGK